MIAWAQKATSPSPNGPSEEPTEDLVELYCGNGNFTIPAAENFRTVVATELSRVSVSAARENLKTNGVANVLLVRCGAPSTSKSVVLHPRWKMQYSAVQYSTVQDRTGQLRNVVNGVATFYLLFCFTWRGTSSPEKWYFFAHCLIQSIRLENDCGKC